MRKLIFFTIFIPLLSFGQVWVFEEGGNPFDGQYRTAQITANNGEFPYHESKLVVNIFNNKKVNVYITESGYYNSTSELEVLWAFDNEPNVIYGSRYNGISAGGKTIFFEGIYTSNPYKEYSKFDLIEKLKSSTKVSVRLRDPYGKNDVSYSLSGSTAAIGFVFENYDIHTKIEFEEIVEPVNSNSNSEKSRIQILENVPEPIVIIPNSLVHMFNSYMYVDDSDTIFAFGYPVVGQSKKEYIYFNSFKKFSQFTEDIKLLFSIDFETNAKTQAIKGVNYQLTLYPSQGIEKTISLTTKDGITNKIFRWSFIKKMKPKLDKFKSKYYSSKAKLPSLSDSITTEGHSITDITFSNLKSNLNNGEQISITYRKKGSSNSITSFGTLSTIAHNRVEYFDNEKLKVVAIFFSYLDSITVITK